MVKLCSRLLAIIAISSISLTANAGFIKFNGAHVKALDLNGQVASFTEFYNYSVDSAHTGLEMDSTIVMFVAELNGSHAIYTIANKANSNGTRGLFKTVLNSATGAVEFLDDPTNMVMNTMLRFQYAAGKTDGFIFKIDEAEFDFTQTISSVNGRNAAVGASGVRFVNFTDGTLASAQYSELLVAQGDFNLVRSVSAPAMSVLIMLSGLGLIMRRRKV